MRLLLDTHAFLWFILDDPKLSLKAKEALINPENELYLSIASIWEMAIKVNLGRLMLKQPFEIFIQTQLNTNAINILPIALKHCVHVASLAFHHRDPFDRLIVSQCLAENIPLVSADVWLDHYAITRIW